MIFPSVFNLLYITLYTLLTINDKRVSRGLLCFFLKKVIIKDK
jgi:hypothetical protein